MKNIEFTTLVNELPIQLKESKLINLYDYQKNLLNNLDDNRFITIQHSRQMGITTMLTYHICNFLINNTNDKKLICLKTNNSLGKDIINNVRNIIQQFISNGHPLKYEKNSYGAIKLNNGNEINLVTSLKSLIGQDCKPYSLIVDNAAWVKDLQSLISDFMTIDLEQIILTSGKRKEENYFYDEIFKNPNSIFFKLQIDWKLNPNHNSEWYDNMKKMINDDDIFNSEINLFDVQHIKITNKARIINIRLDDDMLSNISKKLIDDDLSISEYIRQLIKNDLY